MKSIRTPLLAVGIVFFSVSSEAFSQTTRFWNPSPLSGDWSAANTAWSATSGGTPEFGWVSAADQNAVFDQAGTYTVNSTAAQTAGAISVSAGNVTLTGSLITSNSINVSSGATLTGGAGTLMKSGTTALTVNGTLNLNSSAASGQRISIAGGSGVIHGTTAINVRTGGSINFSGDLTGGLSFLTEAGGTFTLGGNNSYTGNTLIRNGNTVRLNSANALSSASFIRIGGGTNIFELAAGDLSRTLGSGLAPIRFHGGADGAGSSGFAAIGANRNVAINGTVVWGSGTFNPTAFHLGTAASTHIVDLTTNIDLGNAARTINVENGSSTLGGRVSGNLTNGTLTKAGTGTLALAGNNSFGTTLTFGTAAVNLGAIRLESNNALGGVTVIAGNSGTGSAQARIELANNVTISGIEYRAGGRSNATTTGAAIVNVSGNNTWTGTIRVNQAGGGYGIRSDSGLLTLSGTLQNGIGSDRTWELGGAGDLLVSGPVVNGGSNLLALTKFGDGTMTVTGNTNTYTGGTTINAGTLLVNNTTGSGLGTGAVTVNGGTLGGTGGFTGDVAVNATGVLSPGASIESLNTGALAFNNNATFLYELNTDNLTADLINANGNLSLDGAVTLSLVDLGSSSVLTDGSKFTLISYAGSWNGGIFSGFADDSLFMFSGNQWRINYNDLIAGSLNGGAFANGVTLTAVAVPEPSTMLLLAGLGAGAIYRKRRKSRMTVPHV